MAQDQLQFFCCVFLFGQDGQMYSEYAACEALAYFTTMLLVSIMGIVFCYKNNLLPSIFYLYLYKRLQNYIKKRNTQHFLANIIYIKCDEFGFLYLMYSRILHKRINVCCLCIVYTLLCLMYLAVRSFKLLFVNLWCAMLFSCQKTGDVRTSSVGHCC